MKKLTDAMHRIYNKKILKKYLKGEVERFIKSSDKIEDEATKVLRADYRLAVAVHTIEKGLGHQKIKRDFGIEKVKRICRLMNDYLSNNYPQNMFGFREAYAIVEEYIKYKKAVGEDLAGIEETFEQIRKLCDDEVSGYKAGKVIYTREQLECRNPEQIEAFIKNCHSIRNYADKEVLRLDIEKAILLAGCAPSACNRQPIQCYYTMDKEKIKKIDNIIPGNVPIRGTTPNYIVVTGRMTHFGRDEFNQWYVNGGIYIAYLRQALCVYNIGNCIYQWGLNADEQTMRQVYHISDSEVIIGVLGIGYYDEESHCIQAQRKNEV